MKATHRFRFVAVAMILMAACTALSLPRAVSADDLKDGERALQTGQLDLAMKSFEKAASQGLAAGRAGVGRVHLRRRQLDKAMEAFQTAQKMDAGLAWAYYGQAEVLRRQEKCQEAIPLLEKANDLDRKFPEAKLALGDCLVKTKQHDKGVATLSEGLKWGPKWRPRFLVALGSAEMSRDSLRDAGIYFTKAREEAPGDPQVRRALGDFYMQRGTWALAVPEHAAAVEMDSTDVELRYSLAQALFYAERYNEALDEYHKVLAQDPEFAPALLGIGNLLYLAGQNDPRRFPEAREPLEKYTKAAPNDGKGWSLLGRTLFKLGQKDDALAAMLKAESLGDKSKDMYCDLGGLYASRRDWAKALEAYDKCTPGPKEMLQIAQMYVFMGRPEKADSLYQVIVEKDSTTGDAKFALNEQGKMRYRDAVKSKDAAAFDRAIGVFQRRIALDPKGCEAYYYIGLSHKEIGAQKADEKAQRNAKAIEALEKSVACDSSKGDRWFWLGVMYDGEKRQPDAKRAFERSIAWDDTSKLAGKAHRQLGFYLLLEKNWPEAVKHLDRSTQLDDKDVQAWVWLAQGYQNSGNRAKALEGYRKALELDPNQADAKKGIQVLQGG